MSTVQDRARVLYNECPTVKPDWEQLGDVTRSVWIEKAEAMSDQAEVSAVVPAPVAVATNGQVDLF